MSHLLVNEESDYYEQTHVKIKSFTPPLTTIESN